MRTSSRGLVPSVIGSLAILLMACTPGAGGSATPSVAASASASASEAAACAPESMQTKSAGTFTIGTDNPAFPPYFDPPKKSEQATDPWEFGDPTNGRGFESAIAYALAEQLGYTKDQVSWVPVQFNNAIAPGPKDFDVYLAQVSFSEERTKAVDMSEGYWFSNQALVTNADSPLAKAKTVAEVARPSLARRATRPASPTSPTRSSRPRSRGSTTTTRAAKAALEAGQVDGVVFDLATAF